MRPILTSFLFAAQLTARPHRRNPQNGPAGREAVHKFQGTPNGAFPIRFLYKWPCKARQAACLFISQGVNRVALGSPESRIQGAGNGSYRRQENGSNHPSERNQDS